MAKGVHLRHTSQLSARAEWKCGVGTYLRREVISTGSDGVDQLVGRLGVSQGPRYATKL